MAEFFELNLVNLTMDAYKNIFLELLTYATIKKMRKLRFKDF